MVNLPKIMTTITFDNGAVLQGISLHIIQHGLSIDPVNDKPDLYELFGIKSIMPDTSIPYKDRPKAPSDIQTQFMNYLQNGEYVWDKPHSVSAAGVILKRKSDGDFWFFGLGGEIMHNPEALISIKL